MTVETENGVEQAGTDAEAAALAEALAGYNARGGSTPPADEPNTPAEAAAVTADAVANTDPANVAGDPPADPAQAAPLSLEDRLKALQDEVRASAAQYDPVAIRKMHGEIGDINRKIKQIQEVPAVVVPPEPEAPSELDAAIAKAEEAALEFPELAGPLVAALKLASKQQASQPGVKAPTQEEINAMVQQRVSADREAAEAAARDDAVKVLKAEHPDFATVRDSSEFATWVKTKPAELQEVILHTENPVIASRYLTEFKDTVNSKQKKQNRLSSAITPTGVSAPPNPSQPTDMDLALMGYNKGNPRPVKQIR